MISEISQVCDQVWNQIYYQVHKQVADQVRVQVRNQVRDSIDILMQSTICDLVEKQARRETNEFDE